MPSCKVAGSATVECESPSMPDSVYACQIYTVNYTSYDTVQEFKGKGDFINCNIAKGQVRRFFRRVSRE